VRTNTWMSVQCLTIGLGLRATQLRDRVVVAAAREVLDGVRMETTHALRQTFRRPGTLPDPPSPGYLGKPEGLRYFWAVAAVPAAVFSSFIRCSCLIRNS